MSIGALAWLMLQHLTRAVWSVVLRRLLENLTRPLPWLALGFIPVALHLPRIYSWADPARVASDPALARKSAWLDPTFFNIRAAVYLAIWALLATLLARISARQDQTADPRSNDRMRAISSWGLVLLGLTSSSAGFDWLMSLDPHWASTMFGVYVWAGSLVSSLAALILLTLALRGSGWLGRTVTIEHLHDLGKLLFGFVVFWTYIAFCQYFLIWCANFPEETALVHHPPVGVVEHAELGSLFRTFRGPVLPAPVPVDPTRPVLAGLSRSLGPGLPLPRSLLAHHARRSTPRGPSRTGWTARVLAALAARLRARSWPMPAGPGR